MRLNLKRNEHFSAWCLYRHLFLCYHKNVIESKHLPMKPKIRVILEMAIEEGVRRGYSRAHKHVDNPTEGAIIEHIEEAVMSQIYEYFTFDEETYQ